MDKQTLLTRAREGWVTLAVQMARFAGTDLTVSHSPDGWSVKDVMAHITFWENYALQRLQEASRGEPPQMFGDIDDDELNRINQEAMDAGRAQSLVEVKGAFLQVHQDLMAEIEALPQSQDGAWWALWPDVDVPWNLIIWNTYDHYEEHAVEMSAWAVQ